MTLVLIDGGDDGHNSWSGFNVQTSFGSAGRHGEYFYVGGGATSDFRFAVADESTTVVMGFAFATTAVNGQRIISLLSAGVEHVNLFANADGSLSVKNGSGTVLGTSAAGVVTGVSPIANSSPWPYIEFSVTIDDTVGAFTVRKAGTVILSATNVDTRNGGSKAAIETVRIIRDSNAVERNGYDDMYILTGASETFWGDITVETLFPNGDGSLSQWLGSDGNSVSNYLLVKEQDVVTTDYTGSSTIGQEDLYAMGNLVATTGVIKGVCHVSQMAANDAGGKTARLVSRRAGVEHKGSNVVLTTTFAPVHYCLALDPDTSAAWTIANVNALESGVEVVA